MMFDAMVDRIVSMFDIEQPTAVSWLNERHKRMVGEAEYRLAETSFGDTVIGQADYDLPDTVENLQLVQIGADTAPYMRASVRQITSLRTGLWRLDGADGAYAEFADASGVRKLRLWPTPTSVLPISGFTSIDPADMTYGAGDAPIIPLHLHTYLLDGGIADGYEQAQSRWDLAGPHEQRYEAGIVKLRRYKTARLDSGPTQIQRGW